MQIKVRQSPDRAEFNEWLNNKPKGVSITKQENYAHGFVELLIEINDEGEGKEFDSFLN
jgi:hypothetical protein